MGSPAAMMAETARTAIPSQFLSAQASIGKIGSGAAVRLFRLYLEDGPALPLPPVCIFHLGVSLGGSGPARESGSAALRGWSSVLVLRAAGRSGGS